MNRTTSLGAIIILVLVCKFTPGRASFLCIVKVPKFGIFIILGAFTFVVLVNSFYIFIAQKTWRGISEENSYQTGLHYNQILAQKKRQEALGIKVLARYDSKLKELNLEILDDKKRPIPNGKIEIRFRRMLQQELDFSVKIPFENGRYASKISFPALGKWQAQIVILLAGGEIFQTAQDFFIK